jgi:hypothetical protein
MTLIEAAKLTLEALESIPEDVEGYLPESCTDAVIALRTAIEAAEKQEPVAHLWQHSETGRTRIVMPDQIITADANWLVVGPLHLGTPPAAQQEPVAWIEHIAGGVEYSPYHQVATKLPEGVKFDLYTYPPAAQRQWVGLTNDEINEFAAGCHLGNSVQGAIYKAQAKLKEKNT